VIPFPIERAWIGLQHWGGQTQPMSAQIIKRILILALRTLI
jgi:hypothetical protein